MHDRTAIGEWELFELVPVGPNTYGLRFHTGFLCAVEGGGGGVIADRTELREWERWEIQRNDDKTVSLKSVKGRYLCAEKGGGDKLVGDREQSHEWERFKLISCGKTPAGHEIFALQAGNGSYISAQP